MSKSLGNVIDPWKLLDTQGADALRWYLLTGGSPWSSRRLSPEIIEEHLRKYILTLWNTYAFWVTYASLEGFEPGSVDVPVAERPEIDRWILAELDDTVRVATDALEAFDTTTAGKRIESFVDDLSNWYVRRSRRRFWRSSEDEDTQVAFLTLWEALTTVARLSAPFTPFISDEIYQNLMRPIDGAPDSVHLSDWPEADDARVDDELRARMQLVRRLVGLGRSARTEAKTRVRQPLRRALVVIPAAESAHLEGLEQLVAEELNVKSVEAIGALEELVSYTVKPNFRALGPRFGADMKKVAAAIGKADPAELVTSIEGSGTAEISVEGGNVTLSGDELDIRIEGREGFSLAREGAYGVALDLDITPDLLDEGLAREVVRAVQDLRKSSGLAVEDRIELWLDWDSEESGRALRTHGSTIAEEVLATTTHMGDSPAGDTSVDHLEMSPHHRIIIGLRKA